MLRIVELYKSYFDDDSLTNYLKEKNIPFEIFWFLKNRSNKRFNSKFEIILIELRCMLLLIKAIWGFKNKRIICFGGHLSLLLLSRLIGRMLGKEYHLYVYNLFFHGIQKKRLVRRILYFLLHTKHTTIIAQSVEDVTFFTTLSKNKVHFIPYCESPGFPIGKFDVPEGQYFFTGGYTNRDYDLILRCAKMFPGIKFVIVVSKLNTEFRSEELPENLIRYEEIDISHFNCLMYNSFGVIVPLKEKVGASGQMLCLGAMKMSKPVIYCDVPSINFYFEIPNCGIPYSIGSLDSLVNGIKKLTSGYTDSKQLGMKAYDHYLNNFTLDKRNQRFLEIIN